MENISEVLSIFLTKILGQRKREGKKKKERKIEREEEKERKKSTNVFA